MAARMRSFTGVRYPVAVRSRICFLSLLAVCSAAGASAQPGGQPRRHFVTISYDFLYTNPLHFAEHPLSDLVGNDVSSVSGEAYDYRTRDGATLIDVLEVSRRSRGASFSVYPLGMSVGPALMLRASFENMPHIRIAFDGPAAVERYEFTDGWARDVSVGLIVADRSAGWGLGSHTFLLGGLGRIASDLGGGHRYFAEGGGGIDVGPLGVELGVKFAWNTLSEPVTHKFFTVPVTIRGTFTF